MPRAADEDFEQEPYSGQDDSVRYVYWCDQCYGETEVEDQSDQDVRQVVCLQCRHINDNASVKDEQASLAPYSVNYDGPHGSGSNWCVGPSETACLENNTRQLQQYATEKVCSSNELDGVYEHSELWAPVMVDARKYCTVAMNGVEASAIIEHNAVSVMPLEFWRRLEARGAVSGELREMDVALPSGKLWHYLGVTDVLLA